MALQQGGESTSDIEIAANCSTKLDLNQPARMSEMKKNEHVLPQAADFHKTEEVSHTADIDKKDNKLSYFKLVSRQGKETK